MFLIAAIAGSITALGLLLVRGGFRRTVLNVLGIFAALGHQRAPYCLPHGVSIAIEWYQRS